MKKFLALSLMLTSLCTHNAHAASQRRAKEQERLRRLQEQAAVQQQTPAAPARPRTPTRPPVPARRNYAQPAPSVNDDLTPDELAQIAALEAADKEQEDAEFQAALEEIARQEEIARAQEAALLAEQEDEEIAQALAASEAFAAQERERERLHNEEITRARLESMRDRSGLPGALKQPVTPRNKKQGPPVQPKPKRNPTVPTIATLPSQQEDAELELALQASILEAARVAEEEQLARILQESARQTTATTAPAPTLSSSHDIFTPIARYMDLASIPVRPSSMYHYDFAWGQASPQDQKKITDYMGSLSDVDFTYLRVFALIKSTTLEDIATQYLHEIGHLIPNTDSARALIIHYLNNRPENIRHALLQTRPDAVELEAELNRIAEAQKSLPTRQRPVPAPRKPKPPLTAAERLAALGAYPGRTHPIEEVQSVRSVENTEYSPLYDPLIQYLIDKQLIDGSIEAAAILNKTGQDHEYTWPVELSADEKELERAVIQTYIEGLTPQEYHALAALALIKNTTPERILYEYYIKHDQLEPLDKIIREYVNNHPERIQVEKNAARAETELHALVDEQNQGIFRRLQNAAGQAKATLQNWWYGKNN